MKMISSKKMAAVITSRVWVLLMCYVFCVQTDLEIPNPAIQALKPTGIKILFPDVPGVNLFVFQGNINSEINDYASATGTISANLIESTDGRWLHQDDEVALQPGDVVHYYFYYMKDFNGELHTIEDQSFVVRDLVDSLSDQLEINECQKTLTEAHNMKVCGGRIIFQDNFDSLREDLWRLEQYIPDEPDYTFVSYQHPPQAPTISVEEGNLKIVPMLLQNLPAYDSDYIISGTLNLTDGCTSISRECITQSMGADILPPVVSGRMSTKSFAFRYGTVRIKAKLPQGDWLYPDLILESFYKSYGSKNSSGSMRIAGALGNLELTDGAQECGNKVLYGGVMPSPHCRKHLLHGKKNRKAWSDDFHLYSLRWTPDKITLFVDGEVWGRVRLNSSEEESRKECHLSGSGSKTGSKKTPLDNLFRITLGVAAGGVLEFDDNLEMKPWKNAQRKAILYFWQNLFAWLPTWKQPELLVDYVKVRAL